MSKLSTHVLDTARGKPAAGVRIDLVRFDEGKIQLVKTLVTNNDGRTDELFLDADSMQTGQYELLFHVGDYFKTRSDSTDFLNQVPVRFSISAVDENYHVPLLISPWAYSTYRGS
jgi:5-hydroxyisourate hydrolase